MKYNLVERNNQKDLTAYNAVEEIQELDQPANQSIPLYRDEEFRILVGCVKEYAIFMIDPEGIIKTWNEGAKRIKGYDADEIIGKHISIFYTLEDLENGVIEHNMQMAREKETFEDRGWRMRKDGSVFWASAVYTVCYDNQHQLTGYAKVTRDISEQKQIDDSLVQLVLTQAELVDTAYEKLFFHIENTPLGFIEWDDKFQMKSLSKRAEEIFGWNLDEFIAEAKTGFTQVHDEDRLEVQEAARQLLSGEVERSNIQHRNYTKDGRVIWCDWFNSVSKDKEGNVITIMSLVQDITERKKNEEKLKQNELRFKEAEKMAHVGNWELNFSTGILTWSEEALRIYGLPIENTKLSRASWFAMVHPEDLDYVKWIISKAELEFSNTAFFHRIIRNDGSIRHLYCKGQYQFDDGLKPVGLYGIAQDVTELKETGVALKQSESRYQQIVETAQEGIWLVDENNITTFVNKKMCEIFEYTEEEMLGKDLFCFMDNAAKEIASRTMEKIKKSEVENSDFRFIKKDNCYIWTNVSVNPILDENGNYKGALAMVSDITEKKILQQQLVQEQIDNHKEITKAVINAQEKERSEIGEELHDNVNQLLTASKLYLNHSLTQPENATFISKAHEYVEMAMEEIRKLSHLLVGPSQGNTIGIIDSIGELINNLSILKDVKIRFSHSTYCEANTEVGLKLVMYRIIQEQLNNILKHAEASEVLIELKEDAHSQSILITDNGKGFDSSVKSPGIGLKNIRNRAELYNGSVEFISSPGHGCKMKIVFYKKGND